MYATADMLLTSTSAHAAEQTQEPAIEVVLVRAVLGGDRRRLIGLFVMKRGMVPC